jgi:dipeptidase E
MKNGAKKQIIAIGGGGFQKNSKQNADEMVIERYFLDQTGKKRPRICFIPTASAESPKHIIDFYQAFLKLDCQPTHLSLFNLPTADLESFILAQDAIYVGGGNTKSMLVLWREWNLDTILQKAWQQGIVLGGVSAGSICWFQQGITDSIPGPLTVINALGFLKGSNCPHYDGETERRPSYHNYILEGKLKSGIAIDDNVAVHFVGEEIANVIKANPKGNSYFVSKDGDKIKEEKL